MENSSRMEAVADRETNREYTAEPRHRHRDPAPVHSRFRSLRTAFFGITAFWGFTVGATAAVIALVGAEANVRWGSSAVVALTAGAVAAVAGGFVASRAYWEIKSRK